MTCLEEFNQTPCDKIDAKCVNAYVTPELDPLDPTRLLIDSSWGTEGVDLTPAVKAAETVTTLKLAPTDTPLYLQFDREDGEHDCIYGDDLSRIISMTLLKDVDQDNVIEDGGVYMYDGDTNTFKPFDLQTFVNNTNARITVLEGAVSNLQTAVNNLTTMVNAHELKLTPPAGSPDNVKVAFGNINLYSDNSNSQLRTSGLYTHDLSTTIPNDEYFA